MPSDFYESCLQCPRKCGANRNKSRGFCGENSELRIALSCLHFGEEPLLTVFGGSGTIFFTGCTLRCAFCQNYQISQQGLGRAVQRDEFVRMCLDLEKAGAENINLVTGSHHIPKIAEFLSAAKDAGLGIPVAWNSSAYELPETLELLRGLVDIWLPDFKTLNGMMSGALFDAADYPSASKRAIRWMLENFPLDIRDVERDGEAREKIFSGVIIRHLVLPGRISDTMLALDWLKKHADSRAIISLMSQYTPVPYAATREDVERRDKKMGAFENRLMSANEDAQVRKAIGELEFEWLFYQDLSDDESWLPDFKRKNPFSNKLSKTLWHFGG